MDSIIQTAEWAVADRLGNNIAFQEYIRLSNLLKPPPKDPIPPRYVFDQKAIRTATELTLGRPKVQRDILRYMRVPYSSMWVEWEDAGREELRRRFRQDKRLDAIRPFPSRMGFFIEAEEGGRKGRISWAWSNNEPPAHIPNVSAIIAEFDLDGDFPIDLFEEHPLELAQMWKDNQIQYDSLLGIWRTVQHIETPTALATHRGDKFARDLLFADVVGEYIIVWACLFLLTAHRKAVDYREVDLSRLNKHRLKNHKTPLLDHQTVHIHLGPTTQGPKYLRGPLDFRRKSPHIHQVSSYIGHRKDKHWLILPFLRGSGPPRPRTTHVHG